MIERAATFRDVSVLVDVQPHCSIAAEVTS